MGLSTDAILWYGIELGESLSGHFYDLESEKKIKLLNMIGIELDDDFFDEENLNDYIYKLSEYLEQTFGCTIDSHCSSDYPLFTVIIQESKHRAWRGYPEEISSIDIGKNWDERLKKTMNFIELPWEEPKWWLCSDMSY